LNADRAPQLKASVRRIKVYLLMTEIAETVLTYTKRQFDAWIQGDKSLIPSFVEVPAAVANQPHYHFFEAFTLRHYHESFGWRGFWMYALGPQLQGSESRKVNRSKVEDIIPAADLERFRKLQAADPLIRSGAGEPDLFLYKESGAFMFVEVKKGRDRLRRSQIRCIALVQAVLGCPVDIVYVREQHQTYRAKSYAFDLTPFLRASAEQALAADSVDACAS
jgi:VRR-NUC domain